MYLFPVGDLSIFNRGIAQCEQHPAPTLLLPSKLPQINIVQNSSAHPIYHRLILLANISLSQILALPYILSNMYRYDLHLKTKTQKNTHGVI